MLSLKREMFLGRTITKSTFCMSLKRTISVQKLTLSPDEIVCIHTPMSVTNSTLAIRIWFDNRQVFINRASKEESDKFFRTYPHYET